MTHALATISPTPPGSYDVSGASSDDALVDLWLRTGARSANTIRAYRRDAGRFRRFVDRSLKEVKLVDVQAFADSLTGAPSTRARALSAVKSLLSFGHRTGYLVYNVGSVVSLPKSKNVLAERILAEEQVQRMLALDSKPRNQAMLRVLYGGGVRVSELAALKWRDLRPRDDGGQVTVFGKGSKTRTILLSEATWAALIAIRGDAGPDDPVFASRKGGGHLHPPAVWTVVRKAAVRAGIKANVSGHWLRHAHASHALDRGAPIHRA